MKIGYIYKTTNLINHRIYIGKKHKSEFDPTYYGSGIILQEAIKKHGKENFIVEILCWAESLKELDDLERKYILHYRPENNLYNLTEGGTGGDTLSNHPLKSEIIFKKRQSLKKWHESLTPEKQKELSQKISKSKKGKSNGHEGFRHKLETIEKIRESNIKFDRSNNAEWKNAHAKAMAKRKGKDFPGKYKAVIVNGIEYQSVKHAMQGLGLKHRATFYLKIKKKEIEVIYK